MVNECTQQALYKNIYAKELIDQDVRAKEQAMLEKNNILMRKQGLVVELEQG